MDRYPRNCRAQLRGTMKKPGSFAGTTALRAKIASVPIYGLLASTIVDRCENMTGGGSEAHQLAAKISQAWISFARTGNPNHYGLRKWPAFTTAQGSTMVFDNGCRVENNADREELM